MDTVLPSETTLQMFTVEYTVTRNLDLITPAPTFSIDPASEDYLAPDNDQIYRPAPVETLGFIDPDAIFGTGAMGDRFLNVASIQSPITPPPNASIIVAASIGEGDGSDGVDLVIQEFLGTFPPSGIGAFLGCVFIPQGSGLSLGPITLPDGSEPIRVRLAVAAPQNRPNLARYLEECCCIQNAGDGDGDGDGDCEIGVVIPNGAPQGPLVEVTVVGTNFPTIGSSCSEVPGGGVSVVIYPVGGDPLNDRLTTGTPVNTTPGQIVTVPLVDTNSGPSGSYNVAFICSDGQTTEILCEIPDAFQIFAA